MLLAEKEHAHALRDMSPCVDLAAELEGDLPELLNLVSVLR
jgi:hypothetical protein